MTQHTNEQARAAVRETTGHTNEQARAAVRETYGQIARGVRAGCCAPGSCGSAGECAPSQGSLALGYSTEDLESVPEGADMGLGCGNPQAIAALEPGETVLDLGAGGGFDAFLAAQRVGPTGQVIGVDMTPEMVAKARSNAQRVNAANVEFRLGEIEHLPVADGTVNAIISNCVINLSPDKPRVFGEAFRVLKPGGRLAISDVVATSELPSSLVQELAALTGCVAGAASVRELQSALRAAGFDAIRIDVNEESRRFIAHWLPGSGAERYIASANITASKPDAQRSCCGPACCAESSR